MSGCDCGGWGSEECECSSFHFGRPKAKAKTKVEAWMLIGPNGYALAKSRSQFDYCEDNTHHRIVRLVPHNPYDARVLKLVESMPGTRGQEWCVLLQKIERAGVERREKRLKGAKR